MRRRLPLVLLVGALCALGAAVVSAQAPAHGPATAKVAATAVLSARRAPVLLVAATADEPLRASLAAVVEDSPSQTCVSVAVGGRVVFSHQPGLAVAPASNVKLLTAVAVLRELGEEHRFRTVVRGAAPVSGVVQGDLTLVGGGDPLLTTQAYRDHFADQPPAATSLEALADSLVRAGVRRVTGRILGDESRYDTQRTVPSWPARYYEQHQTGPLSALSVNQGKLTFPAHATEENERDVTVTDDPPTFAAETLRALLVARGVEVDGAAGAGVAAPGTKEVAAVESPPLRDLVRQMLSTSDNQTAESFVKELAVHAGRAGTTANGLGALTDALRGGGLPVDGLVLHDGSGLDRDDRASCTLIEAVLQHAGERSAVGEGLAVGGKTGTLRDRFEDPPLVGRIRAKTGTLNDVTALSGFADAEAGPSLTFSYIATGATVGPTLYAIQDHLASILVDYAKGLDVAALAPASG